MVKKMNARWTFLILIGITLLGAPAFAQDEGWAHYFTNAAGDKFYYDPQSVSKVPPSSVKVRTRGYPAREAATMAGIEQVVEFDCQRRTLRKLESKVTRPDGNVYNESQSGYWSQVVPGTSTESLFEKLCKSMGRRFER
jgi:hypothetical protein